ncbi:MAG: nucleoside phosphorylase, partial [Clostridia bacterium]|nr:nucleoside phosphorylase [Clostridia bacterium]
PIYRFTHQGREIGFFQSMIGSSLAAAFLEELIALGAEKFLYFGSCGALDKEIAEGNLLIPSAAYRDEGTSYHYAAPSDYLQIRSAPKLAQIFTELHVPFRTTKTWTTDAFYRETSRNLELRRQEGCGVVEMECAALMAVGQFRKKEVYQFFYAADCLDAQTWDKRMLGQMPADLRERILVVAVETAAKL